MDTPAYILIEWGEASEPTLVVGKDSASARRKVVDLLHMNSVDFPQTWAELPPSPYTDEQVDTWFKDHGDVAGEEPPEIYEFELHDVVIAQRFTVTEKGPEGPWHVVDEFTGRKYAFWVKRYAESAAEQANRDHSYMDGFTFDT